MAGPQTTAGLQQSVSTVPQSKPVNLLVGHRPPQLLELADSRLVGTHREGRVLGVSGVRHQLQAAPLGQTPRLLRPLWAVEELVVAVRVVWSTHG